MCIYSTVRGLHAGGGFYKRTVFRGKRLHMFIISGLYRPFFVPQDRRFRKCGEKLSFADQTDFFSNKTAGNESSKEQCARRFGVFPRTSEIRVRRRRQQAHLRNICPVKTGGDRYGYHPFVSYLVHSRQATSHRVPGAQRPTPRHSRRPSRSSRSHRGHASGR